MTNLKDVIYLSQQQFDTLKNGGSIVKDGETFTYDNNCVYAVEVNNLITDDDLDDYYTKSEVENLITTTVHSILQSVFDNKIGDLTYSNGQIIAQLYESDDL